MRVLVTGASGFIGSHLIPALSREHEVFAGGRAASGNGRTGQAQWVSLDFMAADPYIELPHKMDAIIHLAQAPSRFPENAGEMFAVNSRSTQGLADYARRAGVKNLIYASTGNVYAHSDLPRAETDPCEPGGFYELTKLSSEQIVSLYKPWFDVCILRLFTPYGPGQVGRMLTKIADAVEAQEPVILHNGGQPFVTPIYISDVVSVFTEALGWTGSSLLNVSGDQTVSVRMIAEQAAEFFRCEPRFEEQKGGSQTWNLIGENRAMKSRLPDLRLTSFSQGYNAYLASRN